MTFPNELLLIILSDVLATYVHSLVFLPSFSPRWNAHGVLRSVSKQFKAIADNIWISAVGPEDVWLAYAFLYATLFVTLSQADTSLESYGWLYQQEYTMAQRNLQRRH
jgi:hypothetical protein